MSPPKTPKSSAPTVPEATKTPKAPKVLEGTITEKAMEALSTGNIKDMEGIQEIIAYVKNNDWMGAVGAILTFIKELTGLFNP